MRVTRCGSVGGCVDYGGQVDGTSLGLVAARVEDVISVPTGTVSVSNSEKGFGFSSREQRDDLLVHFSVVERSESKSGRTS
jgi:hypothetical protein